MLIIGLDPSLSGTGILSLQEGNVTLAEATRNRPELKSIERVKLVNQRIKNAVQKKTPDLIVIEGFSFGSKGQCLDIVHYLGWRIREELELLKTNENIPWIEVSPTQLKKFATGKGVANKEIILQQVYKRWGYETNNNNIADAYVLARIGEAYLKWHSPSLVIAEFQCEVIAALKGEKLSKHRKKVK